MNSHSGAEGRRLALALSLFAFGLFVLRADAKSLWWDESLSLFRAQRSLSYILSNRLDIGLAFTIDQHPPLYFVLLHGAIRLFGESDLALRLPSVLAATLTVPLLYVLGKRLAGPRVGLLAGLWAALSPFLLWYAQEVRMYTLVTALGAAGTYALWRAWEEGSRSWAAAYVVTAAVGLATLYFYALLIGVQLLFGLALAARYGRLRLRRPPRWALCTAGAFFMACAGLLAWLAPPQLRMLVDTPLPGRTYVPLLEMLLDALHAFALGLSVEFHEIWPLQVLYLPPYLLGLAAAWRQALGAPPPQKTAGRLAVTTLLLGFVVLPLLFFWLVSLYKPIYMGSRYIILFSPSFYLGLAMGMDWLWRNVRTLAVAATLVLAAGMAYSSARYHTHPAYVKENYAAAAEHVLREELPGDAIVLTAPENIFAFRHYYRGWLSVTPLPQPPLAVPDPATLDRALRMLAENHDRLWLVHCRTQWSDPDNLVLDWMNRNLLLLQRAVYPSYGANMTVYLYATRSPMQDPAAETQPVALCAEKLALLDWSVHYLDAKGSPVRLDRSTLVPGGAAPAPAPGGGALGLRLLWQVRAPLDGYKLSLRLLDGDGRLWAQNDERPLYYWPTHEWPVGSVVAHALALTVPVGTPAGVYTLALVPYLEVDSQPLACPPLGEGGAPLILGTVRVGTTPLRLTPPPRELAPRAHRLPGPVALGPLRLMGHSVSPPSGGALAPGQTLDLALWWLAVGELHGEYDLVIHWAQGRRVLDRTVLPLPGGALRAGQPLLVRLHLVPPDALPPGDYTLRLLLYDRRQGAFARLRLGQVAWPASNLRVGSVTLR